MRFIVCVLLFVLSGCAQMAAQSRDYLEPSTGDIAKVRFSTNGTLHLIPNRNCLDWSSPRSGLLLTSDKSIGGEPKLTGKIIGMKGNAPKDLKSSEVRVTAEQPIVIVFSSLVPGVASCDYSFAFVPKVNEEYQVSVWHDLAAKLCRFEPTSLTNPTQRVYSVDAEQCH